jgi:hypothetical protein
MLESYHLPLNFINFRFIICFIDFEVIMVRAVIMRTITDFTTILFIFLEVILRINHSLNNFNHPSELIINYSFYFLLYLFNFLILLIIYNYLKFKLVFIKYNYLLIITIQLIITIIFFDH